jgi:RHS repeat-associated protein
LFDQIAAFLVMTQVLAPIPAVAAPQTLTTQPQEPTVTTPTPSDSAPPVTVNRTVPTVIAPPSFPVFSPSPTAGDITRARVFAEPLMPIGEPTSAENAALAAAIVTYLRSGQSDAIAPFLSFLAVYRTTVWRPSLLANLGAVYRRGGYYSRALRTWEDVWQATRSRQEPNAKTIADFAIGEWFDLAIKFGDVEMLSARSSEVGNRDVSGPAGNKVLTAREGLWALQHHHHLAVASGPQALDALLAQAQGANYRKAAAIANYRAAPAGMSLAELQQMAHGLGLRLQAAMRVGTAPVPAGSVAHLKVGHFSAVVGAHDGGYQLRDGSSGPALGFSDEALADESSGYFLVPLAAIGSGFRAVTEAEAGVIIGRCAPGKASSDDPNNFTLCEVCGGPGGPGGPGGGGGGPFGSGGTKGMPVYTFTAGQVGLRLIDTPAGYAPPRGPDAFFRLVYNQYEIRQPQAFTFWNLGYKWTSDWVTYIQEAGTSLRYVFLPGGGAEWHLISGDNVPSTAHRRTRAQLVRTSSSPIRYERRLRDGSVEVFAQSDGGPADSRRVFLTERIDPQGQTLTFTYDANVRLVAVTDAIGQVTTLAYQHPTDALKLTKVTDPFGRYATLTYNAAGQLASITDVINLPSSFVYGPGDFIASMTTPYGTTAFEKNTSPNPAGQAYERFIQAVDPVGGKERAEFRFAPTSAVPASESGAVVPTGFTDYNHDLNIWNTFYWDKRAMAAGGTDAQATVWHWLLDAPHPADNHKFSVPVPHSVKRPLENRVWYAYRNQVSTGTDVGDWVEPTKDARVLDDGMSQITTKTYNDQGMLTSVTDPTGRRTSYTYAANGIDLTEVRQTTGGMNELLASYSSYTSGHRPQTVTDAAGQSTTYTYNAAGRVLTVTNPLSQTTTNVYDSNGRLQTVTGPVTGTTTTYTYDTYGRVATVTDPESYVLTTEYDALDRVTKITYPDSTFDQTTYARLDVATRRDRAGRITRYYYDPVRRLTATRDPLGRVIRQDWCACGSLDALVDANGNRTQWNRDVQGRVTSEVRADGTTTTTYTYENTTSRLKTVTDPKAQVTTYTYALDDQVLQTVYTNAQIATPTVSYTYDANYRRIASMVDGIGTTTYTYKAVGTLGAGQVATVDGPLTNDTITYSYDELGRVTNRDINGTGVTWAFDTLGRTTGEANVLGTFTYTYDGTTSRPATVTYPNNQTSTYSYFGNTQDHRLQTIHHKYPNQATLSKFDYTYDIVGNIITWRQQADSTAVLWTYTYDAADQLLTAVKESTANPPVTLQRFAYTYDPAGNRTSEQIDDSVVQATHDNLNRLLTHSAGGPLRFVGSTNEPAVVTIQGQRASVDASNLFRGTAPTTSGTNTVTISASDPTGNQRVQQYQVNQSGVSKTFAYDANGNLTSDGTLTFEWDAQNQLVAINDGTHRSEFTYDGFWRRVRIVEKENSSVVSDVRFVWDGDNIAERRDSANATVTARLYRHGLQLNGVARYLTRDHVISVREVTDASVAIHARYDYAPFGAVTKVTGTGPDLLGYTGVLVHEPSGVFLMKRRAYDTALARWLSEDPLGRQDGPNLYSYVVNQPLRWIDPEGTFLFRPFMPNGNISPDYRPQNFRPICDVPAFLGWEGKSCVTKCCQEHDSCYENSRCNWTSWLTVAYDSSCTRCNRTAATCVIQALPLPPGACNTCEPKEINYDAQR